MTARQDAMIVHALVRQALTSAQEVMGENGLNAVLCTSGPERFFGNFPPDNLEPSIQTSQYAKLNEAIEAFYGRGGRSRLCRIGKASFQYAVREQAALLGVAGIALKLLPERQRVKFILNSVHGGRAQKEQLSPRQFSGRVEKNIKSSKRIVLQKGIDPAGLKWERRASE